MRKIVTLILLAGILVSCNFSKGVKTELSTGLTYSYNGFRVNDVKIFDNYSQPVKGKSYPKGTVLNIKLYGIENYVEEDGKIYPGCSVKLTDTNGKEVLESDDIFKDYITTKDKFAVPVITLTLFDPVVAGEKYIVNIHFYDKKKPENIIDIKLEFEVTPNEAKIETVNNGLSFDDIYMASDKSTPIPMNKSQLGSNAYIMFKGLKGFSESDGKVYPGCEVTLVDKNNNTILHNENILNNYADGVMPFAVSQLYAGASLKDPVKAGETYSLSIRIFDKKNKDNEIKAQAFVEVIK